MVPWYLPLISAAGRQRQVFRIPREKPEDGEQKGRAAMKGKEYRPSLRGARQRT